MSENKQGKTVREIIHEQSTGVPSTSDVMDKYKSRLAKELENSQIERLLEEEHIKLKQLRETQGAPIQPSQAQPFLQALFHGRPPQEITAILDALQPEHIDKIVAMNNPSFADFRTVARQPGTDAKTVLDAVRTGVEVAKAQSGGSTSVESIAKSMADMFKTGVEIGQSASKGQPKQQDSFETLKVYHDMFLKPVLDQLQTKDRENMELRMREIESRIVNPGDYIKNIKEVAKDLGLTSGADPTIQLKLKEMDQTERLENRKLDWEVSKHQEDKEDMKQIYGLIGKAIDGPISDFTKGVGAATAKRIESGARKGNTPQIMQIPCPACHQNFDAIAGAPQVICPHCKSVLALQTQAPEQPAQPTPPQEVQTQASEAPQPAPEQPEQPK